MVEVSIMIYTLLTIIYILFIGIIGIMVVWHMFETKKISDKIIGAVMIILIILRILLIK